MTGRQARIVNTLQNLQTATAYRERIVAHWSYQEGVEAPWMVRLMDEGGTLNYMTTKQVELLLAGISAGVQAATLAADRTRE